MPRNVDLHREDARQTKRVGGGGGGAGGTRAANRAASAGRGPQFRESAGCSRRLCSTDRAPLRRRAGRSIVSTCVQIAATFSPRCTISRCTEAADRADIPADGPL